MMTLEQQKLAVCEKLPELVCINPTNNMIHWQLNESLKIWHEEVRWSTEGLQVCHEAEKLLTTGEAIKFVKELSAILGKQLNSKSTWEIASVCCAIASYTKATHEQRLEALCRVWWPERFA